LSDASLDAHVGDAVSLVTDGIDVHFRLHGAIGIALGEFAFTCRELLGWDEARMLSFLCGTSTTSTKPARALARVASLASPPVRARLLQGAPAEEVLSADAEFAAAVAAYVEEYGCRVLEYELAEPSIEERSDLVLALVRDELDSDFGPHAGRDLDRQRETVANEARTKLAGADLQRLERALQRALMAYPVREDNAFFTISTPRGLLCRAALELGRRLASRGQLATTDDIFFLRPDEARTLLTNGMSGRDKAMRRKGEYAWTLAHPGRATYGHDPGPPPPLDGLPVEVRLANEAFLWYVEHVLAADAQGKQRDDALTGIPASPGRYTGPVRVIRSDAEFDRLRAGDVLVCPATSPVWSVLFRSLGAVVTDSGGMLSHPAIIAREFGVPAVVATRVATAKLRDGQVVAVDGTAGTVEVLR
jgi:rifampicin phosphotransferase